MIIFPPSIRFYCIQNAALLAELGIREQVTFSQDQRRRLLEAFERNTYPSTYEKEALSRDLGIPFKSVQQWFFDERKRRKKMSKH